MTMGESYSLIAFGSVDDDVSSAPLVIPSFRMRPSESAHLSVSLVTVGVFWSLLISSRYITVSVNEYIRLETCIHGWYCRRLLANGFSCRLFCDGILVDQSLLAPALSPCCIICLSSFVVSSTRLRHLLQLLRKVD